MSCLHLHAFQGFSCPCSCSCPACTSAIEQRSRRPVCEQACQISLDAPCVCLSAWRAHPLPPAVQGQQMASSIFAAEPEPASAPSGMSEAKRKALYSTSVFAEAPETSAAPKVSSGKT